MLTGNEVLLPERLEIRASHALANDHNRTNQTAIHIINYRRYTDGTLYCPHYPKIHTPRQHLRLNMKPYHKG
jgi:hypothetical protein